MPTYDAAVVGGGPAGSTCAWKLRQAGLDVVVIDRATFPRDKVCAGWITPQVIEDLELDVDDYRIGRRFQPFKGFRVGVIGKDRETPALYDRDISFGIRRCEFDHYLLERSGAELLGESVESVRHVAGVWTINDSVRAALLIGAGGHFCPIAKMLNGTPRVPHLVAAQEGEFPIDAYDAEALAVAPEHPELFFSQDLKGYGWCVRKQDYLNIGFGHLSDRGVREASAEFGAFLQARGRIPAQMTWRWKGHAYLLSDPPHRRIVDEGVLLVGDAAGLAYSQSGEGIRPAIESGLIAAEAIIGADGRPSRADLEPYHDRLRTRFGGSGASTGLARLIPSRLTTALGLRLLGSPWFVRQFVIERWFLHAHEPAVTTAEKPITRAWRQGETLSEQTATPTRTSTAVSRHRSA